MRSRQQATKVCPMRVTLSHVPNPDIMDRGRHGYWHPPVDGGAARLVRVASLADVSRKCMEYIHRNGLGCGNWTGGAVHENGKRIATVSYNGRVWDNNDKEIAIT